MYWTLSPYKVPLSSPTLPHISSSSWHTFAHMGRDDQKEEREVLDSIFPDEITGAPNCWIVYKGTNKVICSDISDTEYRISIALDVNGADEDDEPRETNKHYTLWLNCADLRSKHCSPSLLPRRLPRCCAHPRHRRSTQCAEI